jgi:hypothetical protein
MAQLTRYFVHRWNAEECTFDCICSVCHATACREPKLSNIEACQKKHVCPESALDRWKVGVWRAVA